MNLLRFDTGAGGGRTLPIFINPDDVSAVLSVDNSPEGNQACVLLRNGAQIQVLAAPEEVAQRISEPDFMHP